jgi:transcriptional regulator with XRE-family HTH domain
MEKSLSTRIKQKRNELGISVVDMAQGTGLPKASIYKWESGTKPSDFEQSKILEKFLSGKFDPLFKEQENGYPNNTLHDPDIAYNAKDELINALRLAVEAQRITIMQLNARIDELMIERDKSKRRSA